MFVRYQAYMGANDFWGQIVQKHLIFFTIISTKSLYLIVRLDYAFLLKLVTMIDVIKANKSLLLALITSIIVTNFSSVVASL